MRTIFVFLIVLFFSECQFGSETSSACLEPKVFYSLSEKISQEYHPTKVFDKNDTLHIEMRLSDSIIADEKLCVILRQLALCQITDSLTIHNCNYELVYFKTSLDRDNSITEDFVINRDQAQKEVFKLKEDSLWFQFASYIGQNMKKGEAFIFSNIINAAYDQLKLTSPKIDFETLIFLYSQQCQGKLDTSNTSAHENYRALLYYIDAFSLELEKDSVGVWEEGYNKKHLNYFLNFKCNDK